MKLEARVSGVWSCPHFSTGCRTRSELWRRARVRLTKIMAAARKLEARWRCRSVMSVYVQWGCLRDIELPTWYTTLFKLQPHQRSPASYREGILVSPILPLPPGITYKSWSSSSVMLFLPSSMRGARSASTLSGSDEGLGSVIASACPGG